MPFRSKGEEAAYRRTNPTMSLTAFMVSAARGSNVGILALSSSVLNRNNDKFVGCSVNHVIDEIRISSDDELAHICQALTPSCIRKSGNYFNAVEDSGPNALAEGF